MKKDHCPTVAAVQQALDDDGTLIVRQLQLFAIAVQHSHTRPAFLMEHPMDPAVCNRRRAANERASVWITSMGLALCSAMQLWGDVFD